VVSIGMPVFNGERYLPQAIDAVLAQTYADLELVISDNASTDATSEICLEHAARDRRVRYHRNAQNVGAARNFNEVFRLATGRYFKWAAHDDLIEPDYLARTVAVLESDPSVVLCHSWARIVGPGGAQIGTYELDLPGAASPRPQDRFGALVRTDQWCLEIFGVIRARELARTPRIGRYVSSDTTLRAELGLLGRYHIVPAHLFVSRDHPERSVRALRGHHQRRAWFDPALRGRRCFPHWRILREYGRAVRRVPLGRRQRIACYAHLASWIAVNWNWAWLLANPLVAVAPRSFELIVQLKRAKRSLARRAGSVG
jgi:glycosyltransferase involved in cell wall biosynthesis